MHMLEIVELMILMLENLLVELVMHKLQIVELIMLVLENLLVKLVMITLTGELTC